MYKSELLMTYKLTSKKVPFERSLSLYYDHVLDEDINYHVNVGGLRQGLGQIGVGILEGKHQTTKPPQSTIVR